jgi:mannose-1-phosphate guanylyltransferase/mannose-6-phosphate isomerase
MVLYDGLCMIVVIIAGGSGTRLWPLSTHNYPKHLLSLINDKSLLQNTVNRVLNITSEDKVFVIPEVSHVQHVYSQLSQINKKNIIPEPARRGTASCFLLALSEIKKRNVASDELILFLWADHIVRNADGFTTTMLRAGEIAKAEQKLVFIGVNPTYASTGLGYLERDGRVKGWRDAYNLMSFKEKPGKKMAEKFMASGKYLWNTGYLVGTLATFEREMAENSERLSQDYEALCAAKDRDAAYLDMPSESLETALSEKVKNAIVVPGGFDWADIGSFRDLHSFSIKDDNENHIRGEKVELDHTSNSYVRNDTDVPIAIIGLDNIVVVSTSEGILVTNKNYAQNVGDVAKRLQA